MAWPKTDATTPTGATQELDAVDLNYVLDGLTSILAYPNVYRDGTTDSYAGIQAAMTTLSNAGGGTLYFPGLGGHSYLTSQMLALPSNINLHLDPLASIKATAAMEAVIQTPLSTLMEDRFIRGGFIYCNSLANVGIDVQYGKSFYVSETCVEDFLVAGYRFGNTLAPTSSYECHLYHARTHRRSATVVANSIALHLRGATDCLISNVILIGGETGVQIESTAGGALLENVHCWVRTGLMKYGFVDFANTAYSQCYADSPSVYAWWLNSHNNRLINCYHFNNPDKLLDNVAISVRVEETNPVHTVVGLYCHATSASFRIAKDFEFASGSSGMSIFGTRSLNCVVTTPGQFSGDVVHAISAVGGITSAGEIYSTGGLMSIRAAAGVGRDLVWTTASGGGSGGTHNGGRWIWRCTSDTEAGSDAGSNLQLLSRTDDGAFKSTIIQVNRASGLLTLNGAKVNGFVNAITYGASMTPDAASGQVQTITVTNNTAFAINAPTNTVVGQRLTFKFLNSIGGGTATGAATWNAVFALGSAWGTLADTKRRIIDFHYDGTNWIEVARSADV